MIYNLTREHIKNGTPTESDECAVALCLDDAGLVDASVMDAHDQSEKGGYELYATFEGFRCFVPAPGEVSDFIKLYDNEALRARAEPFRFTIEEREWAGYFSCFQCGERIEVALWRLRSLANEVPEKAPVTLGETCPVCTHPNKAVFREKGTPGAEEEGEG